MSGLPFSGPAVRLADGDIDAVAAELGWLPAMVHAVCQVETAGNGFLNDGRPQGLFEARAFSERTRHRYDQLWPNISSHSWNRQLYGSGGAHQYDRLAAAIRLNRTAALESMSWGLFQIMGFNHAACGFADVEAFVDAMVTGERAHLDAFVAFIRHEGIDRYLRADPPEYSLFTERYNGTGQVAHYSTELRAAFAKLRSAPDTRNPAPRIDSPALWAAALRIGSKGIEVADLKRRLNAVGIEPKLADTDKFDADTDDALRAFQRNRGLAADGWAGPATWRALAYLTS